VREVSKAREVGGVLAKVATTVTKKVDKVKR